jgi:hypothetical protein
LPQPELDDVEDVVTALGDPELADQAIVSMLKLFGIGVYHTDGTPLFVGTETSDADFYLFEPEVQGLIQMHRTGLAGLDWLEFADFHAAVEALGVDISEDDLAQAYQDAYYENPDALISRFAPYVGVEAPIPPFGAWLLLLDGFVPPDGTSQASSRVSGQALARGGLALAQGGLARAAPRSQNLGLALKKLQQKVNSTQFQDALAKTAQNLKIIAMIRKATLTVVPTPYTAHEGHGGLGADVSITATVHAQPVISPFSGQPIVVGCTSGTIAGIGVSWQYNAAISDHGTTAIVNGATDSSGNAKLVFTPKEEEAGGHGYEVRVVGAVTATASGVELGQKLYCADPKLAAIAGRNIVGTGNILIGWHEPEIIWFKATLEKYDVSFKILGSGARIHGTDEIQGNLVQQKDGSWHGTLGATANGGWEGQSLLFLAGGGRCATTWNQTQQLEVFTQDMPNGKLMLQFYPVTDPRGPSGRGKCSYTTIEVNGIKYAHYGDGNIMSPDTGQGLVIDLPPNPGGTKDYPYRVSLPDGGVKANTYWHVVIVYLTPP